MSRTLPPPRFDDPAVFGRVAVLMGGDSSEREISLDSGRNVLDALRARGVDAHAVDGIPALVGGILGNGLGDGDRAGFDRAGFGRASFDRVFNILHGGDGENGVVQGLLQALGVPHTGAGVLGSALTLDKIRTKQVWQSAGLPTPAWRRLSKGADVHAAARELGLPVIVKPSCEGSSVGVSRVFDEADLDAADALAARYPGELLMEQLVVGDEFTVGILGEVALPSIRIVPKGAWYDWHAKYQAEDTAYLCPGLEGEDEAAIGRLALAAFAAASCSGWGRIDVMRDRAGAFFLLEVNTAPGMTGHSLVPKAARQLGVGFEELVWRVLEQTVAEVPAR